LGASGQAAEFYSSAIDSFDAEIKRIDDSIDEIRSGNLLDRLLTDDKQDTLTWYWQLKTLPDAPESRYLYQLLASDEFQEGLKNYRELNFMRRNLGSWQDDLDAFNDMLDTRQHAYQERVPRANSLLAATDLDALNKKRMDFTSRLDQIEKSNDVAALGTPEEQANWARLKHIEDFLASHPHDPDLQEMRERVHLLKGVMFWRLSQSFQARLWNERRAVNEVESALIETQKRDLAVQQARQDMPNNDSGFAVRVSAMEDRIALMQRRLDDLSAQQNRYLQDLAIRELAAQKQRIEIYQIQARYELAAIYDKTTDKAARPQPKANP
jgi:hypothetical protein